jgi:hypothetical protein
MEAGNAAASDDDRMPVRVERHLTAGRSGKGYTWHSNRHTFASRLVMAGVDLRSAAIAPLAPSHLADAVERLVTAPAAPRQIPSAVNLRGTSTLPNREVKSCGMVYR